MNYMQAIRQATKAIKSQEQINAKQAIVLLERLEKGWPKPPTAKRL